jgi:hypothetical protein
VDLDFLDIDLGRWSYVGTQLTARPSIGMRAAWITQEREATYTDILSTPLKAQVEEKSSSWGIGPRFAMDTNWMFGWGLRFIGNAEVDLLFSRYHTHSDSENEFNNAVTLETIMKQTHINTLRPHVDLELGLGWGEYFCCHKWHVDLSATYGFQMFWSQNMFRFTTGTTDPRSIMPNGDLYVHGLTLTAKLDF